eukprot:CAMPEP_0175045690 /NCGR_PEP_ID=MMETSP0052_2-20121109/4588_1 /TAXON_ID=51329 ORGANISM="Polytomella parva, Strain SAG 63-3" /NCGR_SAMPLE_ID=MMETSP0052_2 /ASSEMBLY_ACC=CAM_ASM_000194 /LENGTH=264 /DNA_ID=CAMNT_0016309299 /DNA_START=215 /DNA_END=1006 /DNA_ORIENTATION=+
MERPSSIASRPDSSNPRLRGKVNNLVSVANRLGSPMYVSDRAIPPEDQTVSQIESALRIPSLASGITAEQLASQCMTEDGLAQDPDFGPNVHSLFPDPHQPPASAVNLDILWRRVSGSLYVPTGRSSKLLTSGILDDHKFLGALAAVAAKSELLLDVLVSDDLSDRGVYSFQFYKHGCWQQVNVDNFLPCLEDRGSLAFACSGRVGELWPALVEKAYAKVHGSYFSLSRRSLHESLVDLTGGVGFKIQVDTALGREIANNGHLW